MTQKLWFLNFTLILCAAALVFSATQASAQTAPGGTLVTNTNLLGANGTLTPAVPPGSTAVTATSNANPLTQLGVQEKPIVKFKVDHGSGVDANDVNPPAPPSLDELKNIQKDGAHKSTANLPVEIRKQAIREAAISYGARGGLVWRTYEIRLELEKRARYLDKVFDFRQLLVPAPSGLLIEPPVIDEALNAMLINNTGQEAAVTDRVYNIVRNAKIVSTSRTWRAYLERDWGTVDPPPDLLRPETEQERKDWKELVAQGWEEGIGQADEIFQDDLNGLMVDFQGMVRYRMLLAQGMISPPYALQVDRGVTGGKDMMRVGDRAVQITGVPELITGSDQWRPANQ